jgi:tetratricopeptide (TPR) repeat protein
MLKRRRMQQNARIVAGVLFLAALSGCASFIPQTVALREAPPSDVPAQAELTDVPFFPQKEYQCGPAALAMVLADQKVKVTPDDLVPQVYVPERKGSLQIEMLAAARRHGTVSYLLAPRMEDMLREVAAGNPVLVLQDLGFSPFKQWHYAVVTGYDLNKDEIILHSGEKKRHVIPVGGHEYVWRKSGYWGMVVLPPDRLPATVSELGALQALAAFERVNPRGAQTGYKTFLKRWPDNIDGMIGLANTHYAAGELKEAEAVLRRAQKQQPESVVVLNNLAQALSDQGRNKEALLIADRAAAVDSPFNKTAIETRDSIRAKLNGKR